MKSSLKLLERHTIYLSILEGLDFEFDESCGDLYMENYSLYENRTISGLNNISDDPLISLPFLNPFNISDIRISTPSTTKNTKRTKYISESDSDDNSAMAAQLYINKFHGLSSERPEKCLAEFDSYATLNKISSDDSERRIAAFHLHLEGHALTWFVSLSERQKESWNTVKDAFPDIYIDLDSQFNPALMG